MTRLQPENLTSVIRALPKAELHLHVEGSIRPRTVIELAAQHGVAVTEDEARRRYEYCDFLGFLEAFKWVVGFLRTPADYGLITQRMCEELLSQNVVYAEVITAVGVMLWQQQDPESNLAAMAEAARPFEARGLTVRWIPDAAWQFGPEAAMAVARRVAEWKELGVIGFGMGGDEMMYPYEQFRPAFEHAASAGLRLTAHAGEVGPPQRIRDAIDLLGAERIGHGIAAMHEPALMELLTARRIALEVCPTSNICTGALAKQLGRSSATLVQHPLRSFVQTGLPVTLSTDDPAMFHTDLLAEYGRCATELGFSLAEIVRLARASFEYSFLPAEEKRAFLERFANCAASLRAEN